MAQTRTRLLFLAAAVAANGTLPSLSFASVSLKNGNFFVGYTDILYPGGFEPKIDRIYNSKSPYKSMFGWGWGNEYEVYLNVSADGSVVIHEYGGGAENRFSSLAFKPNELEQAVNQIAGVAQKVGIVGNATALAAYKQKLKSDAMFRNEEWEKFRSQGKLQARQLPTGTQLRSNRFSYEYITKTADGYIRNFDTGKIERFDNQGHLQKMSDKNGNFIELTYGKDGHVQKIVDNFNRKMFFTFDNKGFLSRIDGENSKKVEYRYSPQGDLVYSRDADGNTYTYKYDIRHNLTQVAYTDNTTMDMTYWGKDKHENIKSVKDPDKSLAEYSYDYSSGYVSAQVTMKGADGKVVSTSKYEYYSKNKADGEDITVRTVTTIDGDRTDSQYNDLGLPSVIKRGNQETSFFYDAKGHVTRKITTAEVTDLHYDPAAGKVDRVTKTSRTNPKDVTWSQFQYDTKANLIAAKNSEGKGVRLVYDSNGRIKTLVDQNKHQISFKYNENSKPVEITDPELGSITVQYTNSGEIKKVDSTAGRKIALQVTSSFQNLLEIIRPAGVTLSF